MKNVYGWILKNYSLVLSISALVISLINLFYLLLTNKKNLKFCIRNYSVGKINEKNLYIFNIEFINKSRLPISVNEISLRYNKVIYKILKYPKLIAEKDSKRNGEILKHQEIHSIKFPINLAGLCSEQCFIVAYGPKDFKDIKTTIEICTNRGKVQKKIYLHDYYLESKVFSQVTSEFYD